MSSSRSSVCAWTQLCAVSAAGGFLAGVLRGVGDRDDCLIVAAETHGADSFAQSFEAGKPATIPITSIAKSLGAGTPSPTVLKDALASKRVYTHVVSGRGGAMRACLRFRGRAARARRAGLRRGAGLRLRGRRAGRLARCALCGCGGLRRRRRRRGAAECVGAGALPVPIPVNPHSAGRPAGMCTTYSPNFARCSERPGTRNARASAGVLLESRNGDACTCVHVRVSFTHNGGSPSSRRRSTATSQSPHPHKHYPRRRCGR